MIYSIVIYLMDTRLTFTQNGGFGGFISLLIILGFAGIPWAYILNFMFKSAPSAYSIMIICAIVTGIVGPLATIFLRLFYSPCDTCVDLALISDIIRYILSWIGPFFTFGHGVNMLVEIQEKNAFCANSMTTSKLKALCETLKRIKITEQMKNTVACCDSRWGVPDEFVM